MAGFTACDHKPHAQRAPPMTNRKHAIHQRGGPVPLLKGIHLLIKFILPLVGGVEVGQTSRVVPGSIKLKWLRKHADESVSLGPGLQWRSEVAVPVAKWKQAIIWARDGVPKPCDEIAIVLRQTDPMLLFKSEYILFRKQLVQDEAVPFCSKDLRLCTRETPKRIAHMFEIKLPLHAHNLREIILISGQSTPPIPSSPSCLRYRPWSSSGGRLQTQPG